MNNIRLRVVTYASTEFNPFLQYTSLREMARQTGKDVAYLSRVRSGKLAITEEQLIKLFPESKAALAKGMGGNDG